MKHMTRTTTTAATGTTATTAPVPSKKSQFARLSGFASSIGVAAIATVSFAPQAYAYDVEMVPTPAGIPSDLASCIIIDNSGEKSALFQQSDISNRFNTELQNNLRNELYGQEKNFKALDRLAEKYEGIDPSLYPPEDQAVAANAVQNVIFSAQSAGFNQQEAAAALGGVPEDQVPALQIPQDIAVQMLNSRQNAYEFIADSNIASAQQLMMQFSDEGAVSGYKAIRNFSARLETAAQDTQDTAFREALQDCVNGVTTQNTAFDAANSKHLPFTGGLGTGSTTTTVLAALGGGLLLLIIAFLAFKAHGRR